MKGFGRCVTKALNKEKPNPFISTKSASLSLCVGIFHPPCSLLHPPAQLSFPQCINAGCSPTGHQHLLTLLKRIETFTCHLVWDISQTSRSSQAMNAAQSMIAAQQQAFLPLLGSPDQATITLWFSFERELQQGDRDVLELLIPFAQFLGEVNVHKLVAMYR